MGRANLEISANKLTLLVKESFENPLNGLDVSVSRLLAGTEVTYSLAIKIIGISRRTVSTSSTSSTVKGPPCSSFPKSILRKVVIFPVGESTALFRVLMFPGIVENIGHVLDGIGELRFFHQPMVTALHHPHSY